MSIMTFKTVRGVCVISRIGSIPMHLRQVLFILEIIFGSLGSKFSYLKLPSLNPADVRAPASQAGGREFEPRFPLQCL